MDLQIHLTVSPYDIRVLPGHSGMSTVTISERLTRYCMDRVSSCNIYM